ncbi:MAG: capsule assembly Wzi family protein [Balneolales bacterium]
MLRLFTLITLILAGAASLYGQTFTYSLETQAIAGTAEKAPFWLVSNRHSMFGQGETGGFMRATMEATGNLGTWFRYKTGVDMVGRPLGQQALYFNQAYLNLGYGAFELFGGRMIETIGNHDETLSSGSMGISTNATPMPKIRLGIPEYMALPYTHGFIQIKGHLAHGWFENDRYTASPYLHEKSAYARFNGNRVFSIYGGLTHFGYWGGNSPDHGEISTSLQDFKRIFLMTGGADEDAPAGWQAYMYGDSRGIWDIGFELQGGTYNLNVYRHFLIEDKDGLKFNSPQDGLLGFSLKNSKKGLIDGIVYEHLYTKWQNGPDGPGSRATGKGGWDNYYNNSIYRSGWTYHERTIGTPLFLTHNEKGSGRLKIISNRIVAHHVGIEGILTNSIRHRFLLTYSRNYGTYAERAGFDDFEFQGGKEQFSFLMETTTHLPGKNNIELLAALAFDTGEVYTNNLGLILGVRFGK